jgi:hypothetical protein
MGKILREQKVLRRNALLREPKKQHQGEGSFHPAENKASFPWAK